VPEARQFAIFSVPEEHESPHSLFIPEECTLWNARRAIP
jgi:hypothetical protein